MDTIYIPTVNRVHQQTTYKALPPSLQKRVVFVVQDWERDQYRYDADYLVLPQEIRVGHPRALAATRKVIYETAGTTKYAILDDDLVFIRKNAKYWTGVSNMDKSSRPCSHQDILEMFELFSGWLEDKDCSVCGCGHIQNPPANKPYRKHTSLASCFWIDGADIYPALPSMELLRTRIEDVNFVLSLLSRGYGNRASTEFCFGNESVRNKNLASSIWDDFSPEDVTKDHQILEEMFPGVFVVLRNPDGSRVKGGFRNAGKTRVYWNKAYKQSLHLAP